MEDPGLIGDDPRNNHDDQQHTGNDLTPSYGPDGDAGGGRAPRRRRLKLTAVLSASVIVLGVISDTTNIAGDLPHRIAQLVLHLGRGTAPAGEIHGPGNANKCVDVDHNTNANGNKIQLWTCDRNNIPGQRWTLMADKTLRSYGKCLTIDENSANLQLWDCIPGLGRQKWQKYSGGRLRNPESGLCLDDHVETTTNGTPLEIFTCDKSWHQIWHMPK